MPVDNCKGFVYAIILAPEICNLSIHRVNDDNTQTSVCYSNISKESAIHMVSFYGMEEVAKNFFKTPMHWMVPDHSIKVANNSVNASDSI